MLLCRAAGVGGKVDQKCAAGQFRQDNTTFCARPASYGGGGHVRNLCWTSSYGQSPGGSRPKLWVGPGTDPWLSLWGVERGRGLSQGGLGSKIRVDMMPAVPRLDVSHLGGQSWAWFGKYTKSGTEGNLCFSQSAEIISDFTKLIF